MAMRKLQVLDDSYQNNPLFSGLSYLTTVGEAKPKQESVLEIAKRGTTGAMRPDERGVPSVLTPGSIKPGTSAGGRVIDERTGMGGGAMAQPSVNYSPSMGSTAAPTARAEGAPQAASSRAISANRPSGEVSAARQYTPEPLKNAPAFVNYYQNVQSPFGQQYLQSLEDRAISDTAQQMGSQREQIRAMLASRGLMAGGGTGLEAQLMAQAMGEGYRARAEAINRARTDTALKAAEFERQRAEGLMSGQRDQWSRFVDEQLLPMKIAQSKEEVKQIMLKNGIDQYAIDKYLQMDVNEWPDWIKNAVKIGVMGFGVYTGQPGIVAAGAAYR